jgi:hypothetical protein
MFIFMLLCVSFRFHSTSISIDLWKYSSLLESQLKSMENCCNHYLCHIYESISTSFRYIVDIFKIMRKK